MKPAKVTAIGRSVLRIIGFKSQGFDVVLFQPAESTNYNNLRRNRQFSLKL
jgi:hypothetical protein